MRLNKRTLRRIEIFTFGNGGMNERETEREGGKAIFGLRGLSLSVCLPSVADPCVIDAPRADLSEMNRSVGPKQNRLRYGSMANLLQCISGFFFDKTGGKMATQPCIVYH